MRNEISINFRKAKINDLPIIQSLDKKLFEYEIKEGFYNSNDFIENWSQLGAVKDYFSNLIENQFVYLAEVENKVIGYIIGTIFPEDSITNYKGKSAEIDNIYIDEDYRNSGIGTKFEELFVNWCKKNNVKRIFTTTEISNKIAIDFYKKNGFKEKSTILTKKL